MRRAFSMIELVIVVVIIGIIAAIAVPRMSSASQNTKFTATQASMVSFEKAMLLYQATYGAYPAAIGIGDRPTAVAEFIKEQDWIAPPGIGGRWVWLNVSGNIGIAVSSPGVARPVLTLFDERYDNGDVDTGAYRMIGPAYARLLEAGAQATQVQSDGVQGDSVDLGN